MDRAHIRYLQAALARQLYGEAALLADSAGDSTQRVQFYTNMAQQCSYLARHTGGRGLAHQALQFADRAADTARHEPSPALHAFVSQRQAIAHAQLGDDVAFRSAITAARRELDRGPHETDPPWTRTVSHSEITGPRSLNKQPAIITAICSGKIAERGQPTVPAARSPTRRRHDGRGWHRHRRSGVAHPVQ